MSASTSKSDSTLVGLFDQEHVPTALAARIINAPSPIAIQKLRQNSRGFVAFKATSGSTTRDHRWSFSDMVRLDLCWNLRAFLGLPERKLLWQSVPSVKIEEAVALPPGQVLYLLITPAGSKVSVSFRRADFQVGSFDLVVNFGELVKGLAKRMVEVMRPWVEDELARHAKLKPSLADANTEIDRLQQRAMQLIEAGDPLGARRAVDKARRIVSKIEEAAAGS